MPDFDESLRTWRRHLHRHPETAFEEHATGDFVAAVLEEAGYEVVRGVGGTGLVASMTKGVSPRSVGLRADMDGLPITEVEGREHGSSVPGRMHACGHDGHMAMVLGAATVLAEEGFDGTVRALFQPAEEPGRGARAMIADGLLERFPVDAIHGLHNMPGIPAGHLHTKVGGFMASEDNFEIVITGRGGHAARPHAVVDPLAIGAEVVLALQTVVARNVDPVDPAVLSCTGFETDGARNAIPTRVRITGDTRSFDPAVQDLLERRIRESATGVAAALGADRVEADAPPAMPSEDFGVFAEHVPACFAFLGTGLEPGRGGTPLHSSDYDFNDDVLGDGVRHLVAVAREELAQASA